MLLNKTLSKNHPPQLKYSKCVIPTIKAKAVPQLSFYLQLFYFFNSLFINHLFSNSFNIQILFILTLLSIQLRGHNIKGLKTYGSVHGGYEWMLNLKSSILLILPDLFYFP